MSSNCVQPWRAAKARGIPRSILSGPSRRATIPSAESEGHFDQRFMHKLVRRLTVITASLLESALCIFPPPLLIAKASRFLPCISHPLHTRSPSSWPPTYSHTLLWHLAPSSSCLLPIACPPPFPSFHTLLLQSLASLFPPNNDADLVILEAIVLLLP